MKSLDIRSEPAVRLLAEFLDMDSGGNRVNAEHFAHGKRLSTFHSFDKYDWHVSQRNSDKRTYGLQSYIAIFDHHTKALQLTTRMFRYFLVYV